MADQEPIARGEQQSAKPAASAMSAIGISAGHLPRHSACAKAGGVDRSVCAARATFLRSMGLFARFLELPPRNLPPAAFIRGLPVITAGHGVLCSESHFSPVGAPRRGRPARPDSGRAHESSLTHIVLRSSVFICGPNRFPAGHGVDRTDSSFSAGHGVDRSDSPSPTASTAGHVVDRANLHFSPVGAPPRRRPANPDSGRAHGLAPTETYRRPSAFIGGRRIFSAGHGVHCSFFDFAPRPRPTPAFAIPQLPVRHLPCPTSAPLPPSAAGPWRAACSAWRATC